MQRSISIWRGLTIWVVLALTLHSNFAAKPFDLDDLLSLRRVADAEASPDGKWVAYTVRTVEMEKNKLRGHIWVVSTEGGQLRQMTNGEEGESGPRWSPDGKKIAFVTSRGGTSQIWVVPFDGGEAQQISKLSSGADNPEWSPDGTRIAFTSEVYPELAGDAAQKKRADEIAGSGVKARIIDSLMYRHWVDWKEGKRVHLFLADANGTNDVRELTPGDFEAPVYPHGSDLFAFSPDSRYLVYTRGPLKPENGSARDMEAWSTDANLCQIDLATGNTTVLTATNKGWDGSPVFSPDGKYIAFRSQARGGYEADKFRLALFERSNGKTTYLTESLDKAVSELWWGDQNDRLYFSAEEEGKTSFFEAGLDGKPIRKIARTSHFHGVSHPMGSHKIFGIIDSLLRAPEIASLDLGSETPVPKRLTSENDALFSDRALPTVESVNIQGALNHPLQSWLLRPAGYDSKKLYPFILLIHGGPQSAWEDSFTFRWNALLYASKGYLVMLPNPHGSTGFGQAYSEEISGDWGGAPYEDLMRATDWAVELKMADPDRMAAMGASYGGYMVNWILGHTNRFKAIVSHAGVYNLEEMYGTTEELWFAEWEFKGPFWSNPEMYRKWSPHLFAGNFKTPTLVTHGELDFRVSVTQGLQLFTALRRQGVPSRLVYFPDEGHWINKPKNARLFYSEVLGWLEKYLGKIE